MKKMTVAIHDGLFHADEVFAIAILKKVYPCMKVVRTRNKKILEKADMRVDIGGRYAPKSGDFDHHQENSPVRENGLPYSACGLIWKHFGDKIVTNKEAFSHVDKKLIEFIDADDNGVNTSNGSVHVYSVGSIVGALNPAWDEDVSEKACFDRAVSLATKILDRAIERANSSSKGRQMVKDALKKAKGGFVILPKAGLPKDLIIENKDIKFCIFPVESGKWVASTVSVKEGSFERRLYFPKSWAGLEDEGLEKASGIKDAKFCHKHLFVASAKSKEAIIKMVKKALKK